MFTGIVEELGHVIARSEGRFRFGAAAVLEGAGIGDSTAVNGCCLTIVDLGDGWFDADASPETLGRTSLDDLDVGDPVNLERPLTLAGRLGGHLVQGHVDDVGVIARPVPDLQIAMPAGLSRYVVEKGSVTVDGVSLTVVDVLDSGFTVAVIPHTAEVTTLGRKGPGDRVNLEVDIMAKYAEKLLAGHLAGNAVEEGR